MIYLNSLKIIHDLTFIHLSKSFFYSPPVLKSSYTCFPNIHFSTYLTPQTTALLYLRCDIQTKGNNMPILLHRFLAIMPLNHGLYIKHFEIPWLNSSLSYISLDFAENNYIFLMTFIYMLVGFYFIACKLFEVRKLCLTFIV